jgi:hypothetical protein
MIIPWCRRVEWNEVIVVYLPAVLGGRRGEDAADFADQRPLDPKRAGLVEEVAHLCRHVAEAGRRAEDNRVVVGESSFGLAIGASWSSFMPACRATSSGTSSGTRLTCTSASGTEFAPSATARAICSTCP